MAKHYVMAAGDTLVSGDVHIDVLGFRHEDTQMLVDVSVASDHEVQHIKPFSQYRILLIAMFFAIFVFGVGVLVGAQ